MKEQGSTYKTEANSRRDDCDEHGSSKACKHDERAASCHLPRALGHSSGTDAGQHLALEYVVGNVDTHEECRVQHNRRRGEPGSRDPCGGKGKERHQEKVCEVNPYQSQTGRANKPHEVMVIDPDDGDEEITHGIAELSL